MRTPDKERVSRVIEYVQLDKTDYTFEKFLHEKKLDGNIVMQGNNIVIPCIGHVDASPSLSIDPIKKRYRCFSCDIIKGGTLLSFMYQHSKTVNNDSTGFYDFVDNLLKSDQIMQLQLGFSTIYVDTRVTTKDFSFKRAKPSFRNSEPKISYIELAGKMMKDGKNTYEDIQLFILLMQAEFEPVKIMKDIYNEKPQILNSETNDSPFTFNIENLYEGDE